MPKGGRHTTCCPPWCNKSNKSSRGPNLKFSRISTDDRFEAWLRYADRPDLEGKPVREVNNSFRLCSEHSRAPIMWTLQRPSKVKIGEQIDREAHVSKAFHEHESEVHQSGNELVSFLSN